MLRVLSWLMVTDVSGQYIGFIFRGQAVQEDSSLMPRNIPEDQSSQLPVLVNKLVTGLIP
jgi:hypothetical protein